MSGSSTEFIFNHAWVKSPIFTITLADPINPVLREISRAKTGGASKSLRKRAVDMPEYSLHQEVLTSLSKELERHINNQMREGHKKQMVLHEVDSATFERFVEWAYTGKYKV